MIVVWCNDEMSGSKITPQNDLVAMIQMAKVYIRTNGSGTGRRWIRQKNAGFFSDEKGKFFLYCT